MFIFHAQDIKYVVSSPFLRCLQTAHQICDVLQLPGIHTCNRIVDVISGRCGIYQNPEVPAMVDVVREGIKIAAMDETPLPPYPEKLHHGLKRYTIVKSSVLTRLFGGGTVPLGYLMVARLTVPPRFPG